MVISRNQLRKALAGQAARARVQPPRITTLPAPHGGWNARDALSDMKATDAIQLDNFFPDFGKVTVRRGYTEFAARTGEADAVESLMSLRTAAGEFLLAASGGTLWAATAGGAIGADLATSKTNARWQSVTMNGVLGLVNGADAPLTYDGSTISTMTVDQASGEPALDVADLIEVNVFKGRSYFIADNTQDFWYSAVLTLGGDLTLFPLGDTGTFGGKLLKMVTWTRDGGAGMDDLAVFVMSSGEVIVYQGSDPGSADDWALVGVFRIGAPINRRGIIKLGADVLLVTQDGYSLLSQALPGVQGSKSINLSDRIVNAALAEIRENGSEFGWQAFHYPAGRQILINYPTPNSGSFAQHVGNLATGAWCRFKGQPARCWSLFGNRPYFGGASGTVYRADNGLTDDGADIVAAGTQAFTSLGYAGRKLVKMVRPVLEISAETDAQVGLSADYSPSVGLNVEVTVGVGIADGDDWDLAEWDVADWGGAAEATEVWLPHSARGFAISPSLRVEQSTGRVSWLSTTFMYEPAGAI